MFIVVALLTLTVAVVTALIVTMARAVPNKLYSGMKIKLIHCYVIFT
jgi:hypothetical protein